MLMATILAVATAIGCDKSDGTALLAVKKALGDPPGLSGWNSTVPCCGWKGVTCNATSGRVTELSIYALNVSAAIPAAMANLTRLRTVNLAYNRLYGPIPAFLGPPALPELSLLRLDGNRLSGTIPPTLTVPDLSLVGNLLVGPLPATFGAAQFNSVDLADNQLSGDASPLFGARKQINALRLSRNQFRFDLGRVALPEPLDILVIDHNLVYGAIPPAAAARTRKWLAFDVSFNQLCGPIPQGRLTRRFGPRHFAGNKCLCDRPLPPCTPN